MLVPERGDPTTKIGLFILGCIPSAIQSRFPTLVAGLSQSTDGFRRIQKLPPAQDGKFEKAALRSSRW
jgi:hypothetical protein